MQTLQYIQRKHTSYKRLPLAKYKVHLTTAPYIPKSNGMAERFVRTFNNAIQGINPLTVQEQITNFLHNYNNTQHTTTKMVPAIIFLGRRLRNPLDRLEQHTSKTATTTPKTSRIQKGSRVWVHTHKKSPRLKLGLTKQTLGNRMYQVRTKQGMQIYHDKQIRKQRSPDKSNN
ncbi:unnamed protein product [Gordionus sp. m RMFG-2023]